MKSYTDLEQSKKLAEILPIESADGFYYKDAVTKENNPRVMDYSQVPKNKSMYYFPCWSIAALLELLPKRIEIVDNVYELSIYLYGIYYWNINNGNLCFKSKDKDNLVDACYEAIVFLHEQKLL